MMYDNLGLVSSDSSFNNEYFRFTADQVCHAEGKFITDKFQHRGMFDIPRAWGRRGYSRKTGERSLFSDYEGKLERGSHENPFKLEK